MAKDEVERIKSLMLAAGTSAAQTKANLSTLMLR